MGLATYAGLMTRSKVAPAGKSADQPPLKARAKTVLISTVFCSAMVICKKKRLSALFIFTLVAYAGTATHL